MYPFVLYLHSWLRWFVLLAGIWAIFRSFTGWQNNRAFLKPDNTAGAIFIGTMHLQLLVGLLLYFVLSPVTAQAFQDFGAAMKDRGQRFWAVEHITLMIVAVVVAQIGRSRSKKAGADVTKHRLAFFFFTAAIILVLLSIPWGGINPERPLFRF